MTPTECVKLVKFINARCPAMRLDEATPDAWYLDLVGLNADDAFAAARAISSRQAFVNLHELLAEAGNIQRTREGRERVEQLERQIAQENPSGELHGRPVVALEVGPEMPPARLLARSVAVGKKPASAVDTAAAAREQAQREQARQELEAVRASQSSEGCQNAPGRPSEVVSAGSTSDGSAETTGPDSASDE